jgi:hypothetical protein
MFQPTSILTFAIYLTTFISPATCHENTTLLPRAYDQHTCTLLGYTKMDTNDPASKPGPPGQSWGFELSTETGVTFWRCKRSDSLDCTLNNHGQGCMDCNPRALDGRFLSREITHMNTDIQWQVSGQMGQQCNCIVDGQNYPGNPDPNIDIGGTINTIDERCTCQFPCNTGFADKLAVYFFEGANYGGQSRDAYLTPNYCCACSPLLVSSRAFR